MFSYTYERKNYLDRPTPAIQNWVEETLGSPISGFSLGTADRLETTTGKKAFLKAVSTTEQPQTANLHRAELKAAKLFAGVPYTASLIDGYENDNWVALLMEDIEGKHPQTPWAEQETIQTLIALDSLASLSIKSIEKLEDLTESISGEFKSWERIAQSPLRPELYTHLVDDPNLEELQTYFECINEHAHNFSQRVEEDVLKTLDGDCLVHSDLRADNILITEDREAIIIDWPFACRGAAYFDSASILADIVAQGGDFSWETVTAASKTIRETPREILEGVILAYTGYYLWAAQSPPKGDTSSTLPAFRLQRALNLTRWVVE